MRLITELLRKYFNGNQVVDDKQGMSEEAVDGLC